MLIQRTSAFLNFVSDGPHNNGRSILPSFNCCGQIELSPCHISLSADNFIIAADLCLEEPCIIHVVAVLRPCPAVEYFVDHKYSLLVAGLDQLICRRVVCHADRVTSHLFQDLHLTVNGTLPSLCAECTLVMVHAHTLELHILSVQREACISVKIKVSESIVCIIGINYFTADFNLGPYRIKIGILCAPQFRSGHCYLRIDGGAFTCFY